MYKLLANNMTAESSTVPAGFSHVPVMYREVVEYLMPTGGSCRIVDGTVGCGGHSALLLKQNPLAEVLGIDRDGEALERAEKALAFAAERCRLVRGEFGSLAEIARSIGWDNVDAVLLDIGVSSPQLDDARRGFSFRLDGPLDMRMDTRRGMTAARLANHASEAELAKIFSEYGEVSGSYKLARAVVARRREKLFATTVDFADFCESVLGRSRPGRLPSPTKVFQALRIAVNDELGELRRGLEGAVSILKPGGRLTVISFHSLEDRIVKNFFRDAAAACACPPGLPACVCRQIPRLKVVTRKPVTAGADELTANRRAASARLRAAEKL